ncbi:hypothetical protein QC761_409860 [Podospora bellae-mahoneyi]|uniref:Major facilitator superfamily (MFS) profile domain-containing protein n=1 Tax=Podospora bellae-mahoneyi TaxID=2093777 RepID=A0ABR0FI79_9PEZI|nr:hypothetical protein QC761_409860 [Podospora bellae-mahoneyi]
MVQLGSVGGALIAFLICDRIGRTWATRQLCLLWVLGIVIFMGAKGNLSAIYAGRFIVGLGVGQTPVVGPVYIAEIAPANVRRLCTCIFTGFVYLGIVLAYFTNYCCQVTLGDAKAARWEVPTSLHLIFAVLIFTLSLFQHESPRYLIKQGQHKMAVHVMARLRNLSPEHDYVTQEISAITSNNLEEMEATVGSGLMGILKEAFTVPKNLYRVCLTICAEILSQWSGAGSITLYAPDLFNILEITGTDRTLRVTAVFGIVKLTAAVVCALFLVDFIGRKRSLLIGITLQAVSIIYVAVFLTAVPELGIQEGYLLSPSQSGLSKGAIAMIYISGFGWALGWNSMQYLLTASFFLRIRAFCTSLAMSFHFATNTEIHGLCQTCFSSWNWEASHQRGHFGPLPSLPFLVRYGCFSWCRRRQVEAWRAWTRYSHCLCTKLGGMETGMLIWVTWNRLRLAKKMSLPERP